MKTILELIKSLFNNLSNYFSTRKEITDTEAANIQEVKEEAKDIKQEAKRERKLNKKHEKKKRSYLVSKLKPGMNIRVKIDSKWEKYTYVSHDENGVTTSTGEKFPYGQVNNYHMKELYYAKA